LRRAPGPLHHILKECLVVGFFTRETCVDHAQNVLRNGKEGKPKSAPF
jgi:hypothetical protein